MAFGFVVGAIVVASCNVWVALDNCKSSADCPSGQACTAGVCIIADSGSATDATTDGSVDAPTLDGMTPDGVTPDATEAAVDSGVDAGPLPACDLTSPFGTPVLVPGLDSQEVFSARPSSDELTMFYAAANAPNGVDIFYGTRGALDASFISNGALANVNSASDEYWPSPTTSGLLLFFESGRTLVPDEAGVYGTDRARVWSASRADPFSDFDTPKIQSLFAQDSGVESAPYVHPLGKSLYFSSDARGGAGDFDLFVATLGSGGVIMSVNNLGNVNTAVEEEMPVVSWDELTLFFERPQPGKTARDIWVATRTHATDAFGTPSLLSDVDTQVDEFPSAISPDGCRFYFISNRLDAVVGADAGTGAYRAWVATRTR